MAQRAVWIEGILVTRATLRTIIETGDVAAVQQLLAADQNLAALYGDL